MVRLAWVKCSGKGPASIVGPHTETPQWPSGRALYLPFTDRFGIPSLGRVPNVGKPSFRHLLRMQRLTLGKIGPLIVRNLVSANHVKIARGVLVETVGAELLVVVPGTLEALRLTGEAASTLAKVQAGIKVDPTSPEVAELMSRGIVEIPGISRRGLIKAGAIGAGAGIAVLAMPSAAFASSGISGIEYLNGLYYNNFGIGIGQFVGPPDNWPSPLPSANAADVSALLVDGVSIPIFSFGAGPGVSDGTRDVFWGYPDISPGTPDPRNNWTGEVVGTFVWAGRQFSVTFTSG